MIETIEFSVNSKDAGKLILELNQSLIEGKLRRHRTCDYRKAGSKSRGFCLKPGNRTRMQSSFTISADTFTVKRTGSIA